MPLIRSILFALVFYGLSAPFVICALVGAALGERPMQAVIMAWFHFHRWCTRWILGIEVRIVGTIPPEQTLFAAKHQAMFETVELLILLRAPIAVLKAELTRIPGWGWLAGKYGGIAVDRAGGPKTMRAMLRQTQAARDSGRSIVIFPEGTRVRPGETPALRPGFAGLYRALRLPVVCIAIDSGKVWPKGGFVKYPGTVTFRFADPIPPALEREEIEAQVHREINAIELGEIERAANRRDP